MIKIMLEKCIFVLFFLRIGQSPRQSRQTTVRQSKLFLRLAIGSIDLNQSEE